MSIENATSPQTESEAAHEATELAVARARETATLAVSAISSMTTQHLTYLGCLTAFVVCTLVFDMAAFSVATPGVAVSETVAQAQREAEAKLNSWAYSAFTSSVWGKVASLSALAGIGLTMAWGLNKLRAGWVPLAFIGCAGMTTLMMLLLFFVGFPDLSAYSDASCSATLLGYWFPVFAAGAATFVAVRPLLAVK